MIKIKISSDFTDAPGARYINDGPKSGEEFLEEILRSKFLEARDGDQKLEVDLDDVWGYASSFISGSFGALSIEFTKDVVLSIVEFKSRDEILKEKFINEIKNPKKRV